MVHVTMTITVISDYFMFMALICVTARVFSLEIVTYMVDGLLCVLLEGFM